MSKKISFETLFFIFTIILAIATDWEIYACIFVICSSLLILIDVTPKLWRMYNEFKKNKN